MEPDSRITLGLGLDDSEIDLLLASSHWADATLLLDASTALARSFPGPGSNAAVGDVVGLPLSIGDAGALQRAAAWIDDRYGRLDALVIGTVERLAEPDRRCPWAREALPYRFATLGPILAFLPLLVRARAARIVRFSTVDAISGEALSGLLQGTAIRLETLPLPTSSPTCDQDAFSGEIGKSAFCID
ncbi:hypothetical protein F0A16_11005 [Salinicola corii]|uniref:Uncharacterized protein n=1 Tax=Salinicola corii TaxID=2606937 RepID=A0A640WE32_9GAMM|nr:hypothetical protein [Salinicola corii]KAA0018241.1 hypothetical protein F0A16_11005 [Salinicola corii]